MADCCKVHIASQQEKDSLFWRNAFVAALALLMHNHTVESYLFSPQSSLISLILCSNILFNVLRIDFKHVNFNLSRCFELLLLIAFPFLAVQAGGGVQIIAGIMITLFAVREIVGMLRSSGLFGHNKEKKSYTLIGHFVQQMTKKVSAVTESFQIEKINPMTWLPSIDNIVVVSALMQWALSVLVIYHPLMATCELMLNDAMLTLAVYNLGRWLRSHWQSSALAHNHNTIIRVMRQQNESLLKGNTYHVLDIPVIELKIGDIISVDQKDHAQGVLLPVKLETAHDTVRTHSNPVTHSYRDCASEKSVMLEGEKIFLPANQVIYSGNWRVLEDYQSIHDSKETKEIQKEKADRDEKLTRIFVITLHVLALLIAVNTGYYSGFFTGLKTLCLALMVSCPCIYFIVPPALQNKITEYLDYAEDTKGNIISSFIQTSTTTLPSLKWRKKIVFDRTGTTFVQDPNNPDGPYIISKANRNMIRSLVRQGCEVYLLSGHSTGGCEEHLADTKKLLAKLGVPEQNIMFDKKYHGSDSRKGDVIYNLQHFNHFHHEKPKSFIYKYSQLIYRCFFPATVIMIGDDDNDFSAMRQADMSIAVGQTSKLSKNSAVSVNDNIARLSHFYSTPEGLEHLPGILQTMSRITTTVRAIMIFSALVALITLLGIAGYHIKLGAHILNFSPAAVCSFTTSYCLAVTALVQSSVLDPILGVGPMFSYQSMLSELQLFYKVNCVNAIHENWCGQALSTLRTSFLYMPDFISDTFRCIRNMIMPLSVDEKNTAVNVDKAKNQGKSCMHKRCECSSAFIQENTMCQMIKGEVQGNAAQGPLLQKKTH